MNAPVVSKAIAQEIDSWINRECISSLHDRNKYLDEFDQGIRYVGLSPDDPENFYAQKNLSHHNRQAVAWGPT